MDYILKLMNDALAIIMPVLLVVCLISIVINIIYRIKHKGINTKVSNTILMLQIMFICVFGGWLFSPFSLVMKEGEPLITNKISNYTCDSDRLTLWFEEENYEGYPIDIKYIYSIEVNNSDKVAIQPYIVRHAIFKNLYIVEYEISIGDKAIDENMLNMLKNAVNIENWYDNR